MKQENACWVAQYDKGRVVQEIEEIAADHILVGSRHRKSKSGPFFKYALGKYVVPSPPEFRRDAYRALGGMDNNSPGTLRPEIESDDKIGDAIQRRITSDPLAGMVRRSSRSQSEYSRLMAFIDEVAYEIRIPIATTTRMMRSMFACMRW